MLSTPTQNCPVPALGFSDQAGENNIRLNKQPSTTLDVGIDWITLRGPIHTIIQVEAAKSWFDQMIQDDFVLYPGRPFSPAAGNSFSNSGFSTRGGRMHWNCATEEGPGDLIIILPGKALAPCNFMEKIDILMTWIDKGFHVTRLDLFLDVFGPSQLTFQNVFEALEARNYTGCNKAKSIKNYDNLAEENGFTFNFGSRQSDAYFRMYNKAAEQKKTDKEWWRNELEVKGKQAKITSELIYKSLGYDEIQLKELIVDLVLGRIDFVDRSKSEKGAGNVDRCPRLEWWEKFLTFAKANPLRLSPPSPTKTLEKTMHFLHRQVATSLAIVHQTYGDKGFRRIVGELLADGLDRLTDAHNAVINLALNTIHNPNPIPAF
jgi:hypothetical protein